MATVPQNVILIMALLTLEPPVLAAITPKIIRKIIAKPYNIYSICFKGNSKVTKSGRIPPNVKAPPEAKAACMGLA